MADHSYKLNRASVNTNNAEALEKRFPFTSPGSNFDNIVDYLWHRVVTRYNALCNIQERTEFWREWCIEQDGVLCLPEFEWASGGEGEFLVRAFMTWVRNHVLDEIQCIALGKTMCWRIMADMPEDGDYPPWVIELENMWGKYQEELATQEGAEAAKVFMATRSS